ncbi:MAG TPA: YggS family pyridoxal phosphate-dependent enzyme [Micrococcales bacterium]|uniref:YggS family pyridoxal phosphate-dependent enzyme n=1 Tax=Miniimonas arenae TaxID=676201 RepID=UPI000ECCEF75|nr:YggS family pyridoxal phosphate-dependent enzyme [Miniimonas arenae]HCX84538.1 YggS family pyridoxal phosphate-dependent enzyme [Micrococcales bacterium]
MSFAARLALVRTQIAEAALAVGRDPAEIRLVAVSKSFPVEDVRAALEAGCRDLGESRAQELVAKAEALADRDPVPRWVFIGPLQSNKARDVARYAHELQSLDRVELADALQRRLDAVDRTLDVLVQVNTSGEAAKSGVAPGEAVALARAVAAHDRLRVRGLMTIATLGGDEAETRRCFRALAETRERLRDAAIDGVDSAELSMGMSADFPLAIAEGATTVRVGTALFGRR